MIDLVTSLLSTTHKSQVLQFFDFRYPRLSCMGISEFYGSGDEQEAIATINHALDLGVNFLDTADV